MKKTTAFILSILLLCGCGAKPATDTSESKQTASAPSYSADSDNSDDLSLEEKIGQLFMVRCDSTTLDEISKKQPGAIVMFASDFDGLDKAQVQDKISTMKSKVEVEPFIAVDEEGGTVVRVSSNPKLSPHKFKSPQQYYNEGGMELVKSNAREKSDLLMSLGITMNLAPVADVSENPSDFIYSRSFGKSAEETAEYVSEVVSVMNECNIAACLKHFPGYGGNVDTHTTVAIDHRTLDELRSKDFLPFESGINAGADAVLVSHNIINDIDPTLPATLSKSVHDILRNELSFDGLIITDDMSMAAAANYAEPYKTAVLAGNDIIIVTDFDTAYNEVLTAVQNGEIPTETIDNAVNRILEAKKAQGLTV